MRRKTKYHLRPDGTIELTCMVGGKRKHLYGHSDREVERKRDEAIEQAVLDAKTAISFRSVGEQWWKKHEPTLSPNTVGNYKTAYNRCCDEFGDRDITSISVQDIIVFLNSFVIRGLSHKVVVSTRSILSQIFDHAILCGIMSANPCASVPVIRGKAKKPRQAAPQSDLDAIEAHKDESDIARMCYFMLWTGCRRAEAAALQAKNVDYENGTAYICQAVAYSNTSRAPILKDTKTEAGHRTVIVPDFVIDTLPRYEDGETYIFFPAGLPTKTKLEEGLREFQDKHSLQSTAHQLRHSYATKLAELEVDARTAKELMGHSSTIVTEVYTHFNQARLKAAQSIINGK